MCDTEISLIVWNFYTVCIIYRMVKPNIFCAYIVIATIQSHVLFLFLCLIYAITREYVRNGT